MFDHEHGIAAVTQSLEHLSEGGDVAGVQAHGGFVEHVEHVGQGAAEMADHLDPLGLTSREGGRGPVEAEVAEPEGNHPFQVDGEVRDERCHADTVNLGDALGEVTDLHSVEVGDRLAVDQAGAGRRGESGAVAFGAGATRHDPLEGLSLLAFERVGFALEVDPVEPGDEAFVGGADRIHPGGRGVLGGGCVQEQLALFGGVVADRQVGVEEPGLGVGLPQPGARVELGESNRALVEGAVVVDEFGFHDRGRDAEPLTVRAHAGGVVEAVGVGIAGGRLTDAGEQQP